MERVGYLGNLSALLAGGQVHGDEYARWLSQFANDSTPEVLTSLMSGIAYMTVRQLARTERPLTILVWFPLAS